MPLDAVPDLLNEPLWRVLFLIVFITLWVSMSLKLTDKLIPHKFKEGDGSIYGGLISIAIYILTFFVLGFIVDFFRIPLL